MKYKYLLAHNLKVVGSNPTPATKNLIKPEVYPLIYLAAYPHAGRHMCGTALGIG